MNALCIVEQKILTKVMQELLRIANGIRVRLNELLGQGALVALDATIETGTAWESM